MHLNRAYIHWWDRQFVDYLAAAHDVTVLGNAGTGWLCWPDALASP